MTHDPLCPFSRECIGGEHEPFAVGPLTCSNTECLAICDCDLIAKVRADEQQQVASRLTAYHAEGCIGGVSNLGCGCGLWNDVLTYSVELP